LNDRQLTAFGDARSREATFSPDGRWVAYQTLLENRGYNVFLEPFPRSGARYLVPQDGLGSGHPFWSPMDDEIITNTSPFTSQSVRVKTRPRVAFGQPAPFPRKGRSEPNPASSRRAVDMMPDGYHVLGVLSDQADVPDSQINIVLNWFDELRQRVP